MNVEVCKTIDINPFNRFFFVDCIYNTLFAILEHRNVSLTPLMLNTSIQFVEEKVTGIPQITHNHFLPLEILLRRMGEPIAYRDSMKHLSDDIRRGIENNSPTGVFVDCFDEIIRKDTYKKIHNDHCLMITGLAGDNVIVIEQSNIDTLNYRTTSISLADLLAASDGYDRYYIKQGKVAAHRYFQMGRTVIDETLPEELYNQYAKSILQGKEGNPNVILAFAHRLIKTLAYAEIMDEGMVIRAINDIVSTHKMRLFLYRELWTDACELIEEAVREWSYLRMAVFRHIEGIHEEWDSLNTVYKKLVRAEKALQKSINMWAKKER